jgi:hypothetical protein
MRITVAHIIVSWLFLVVLFATTATDDALVARQPDCACAAASVATATVHGSVPWSGIAISISIVRKQHTIAVVIIVVASAIL